MKIAQIAPLMESVPPRLYGGTERIVSYLTDELVQLGHEVTLFASADSVTAAQLVGCAATALRLDSNIRDPIPYYMLMLDRVRALAGEFDILHFHIDQFHFPLFHQMAGRTVTTLHGRQDSPDLKPLYLGFSEMPLVSISNAQRRPIANANFVATVHHGIPANLHTPVYNPRGGYVAFLGRISPEKRPDRAIAIARTLGIPLKIAAKVDKVDEAYFREAVAPLLGDPGVEFIGEIDERSKTKFLGEARALLFPIDWPEPFGLVMIEAMARGTPVLAFRQGSVPEIIDPGVTGAVVDTVDEAVFTLPHVMALDRHAVRRRFEERFSATRMATDYAALYRSLLGQRSVSERERTVPLPRPVLEKKLNGKSRNATETDALIRFSLFAARHMWVVLHFCVAARYYSIASHCTRATTRERWLRKKTGAAVGRRGRTKFDPKTFLARAGDGRAISKYRKDQIIFSQGQVADAVFYIQQGKVKLTVVSEQGKEAVIAILEPGHFFGEGCLNGHPLRIGTTRAVEECVITRLEKATMIASIRNEPGFSELFMSYLLTRSSRIEEDLIDQLFNSSEKRLARLLLLLANFGKEGKPEPILGKYSQEMLAEMIGTTRSRVSFFMNKFRKLGFIDYNGTLEVHNSLLNVVLHDKPEIKTRD